MTPLPWIRDTGWIALPDGVQTVWVNLDHVRQIEFCENELQDPCALLWSADDLWEIAAPAALLALHRWVRARALAPAFCEH